MWITRSTTNMETATLVTLVFSFLISTKLVVLGFTCQDNSGIPSYNVCDDVTMNQRSALLLIGESNYNISCKCTLKLLVPGVDTPVQLLMAPRLPASRFLRGCNMKLWLFRHQPRGGPTYCPNIQRPLNYPLNMDNPVTLKFGFDPHKKPTKYCLKYNFENFENDQVEVVCNKGGLSTPASNTTTIIPSTTSEKTIKSDVITDMSTMATKYESTTKAMLTPFNPTKIRKPKTIIETVTVNLTLITQKLFSKKLRKLPRVTNVELNNLTMVPTQMRPILTTKPMLLTSNKTTPISVQTTKEATSPSINTTRTSQSISPNSDKPTPEITQTFPSAHSTSTFHPKTNQIDKNISTSLSSPTPLKSSSATATLPASTTSTRLKSTVSASNALQTNNSRIATDTSIPSTDKIDTAMTIPRTTPKVPVVNIAAGTTIAATTTTMTPSTTTSPTKTTKSTTTLAPPTTMTTGTTTTLTPSTKTTKSTTTLAPPTTMTTGTTTTLTPSKTTSPTKTTKSITTLAPPTTMTTGTTTTLTPSTKTTKSTTTLAPPTTRTTRTTTTITPQIVTSSTKTTKSTSKLVIPITTTTRTTYKTTTTTTTDAPHSSKISTGVSTPPHPVGIPLDNDTKVGSDKRTNQLQGTPSKNTPSKVTKILQPVRNFNKPFVYVQTSVSSSKPKVTVIPKDIKAESRESKSDGGSQTKKQQTISAKPTVGSDAEATDAPRGNVDTTVNKHRPIHENLAFIVGIAVGIAVILIIICVMTVLCCRLRQRRKDEVALTACTVTSPSDTLQPLVPLSTPLTNGNVHSATQGRPARTSRDVKEARREELAALRRERNYRMQFKNETHPV